MNELSDVSSEILDKVYLSLVRNYELDTFKKDEICEGAYKYIIPLADSRNTFFDVLLDEEVKREKEKTLQFFQGINSINTGVVLVGIGNMGSCVYDYLLQKDVDIIFADNSLDKQELGFKGFKVYSIEEAVNGNRNWIYVVANINHSSEIRVQLMELGIDESRIIICNDEWFFVRHIFTNIIRTYGKLPMPSVNQHSKLNFRCSAL